ncbi:MAG TPA: zinc finger domain-containing protein, partial [Aquihabitans sp.]|nr:zinc finger domain-containing protein [Aquihabitans sp.]
PSTEAAVALLDQRLASGIGNVYKSELLHRCRVDPFVPIGKVPVPVRRQLLEAANRLLLHNLGTTRRTTVAGPAGSVAVYGKARRPCPRCGTPIRMVHHGLQNRSTYWCPRCQPPGATGVVPST